MALYHYGANGRDEGKVWSENIDSNLIKEKIIEQWIVIDLVQSYNGFINATDEGYLL